MKHKNPDCGNIEIGEGNCPRCWRDNFTCDDKGHRFAENNDICDCRKLTRQMAESEAFSDSEGYEKWTACEKHGAQKGLTCPKCEMVRTKPLVQFCDCYDHDFRKAVRKLAQIMDMQPINDSIKTTASMYVKTANDIDQQRYMKNLEERLEHERLHGGVIQALAERERILGLVEEEYKKHDEEKFCECHATSAIDDVIKRLKSL